MTIRVEVAATPPLAVGALVDVAKVDDALVQPDPVWQDITCETTSFQASRGRDRDTADVRAGTAQLVLNNHTGDWTPVGIQKGRWWDQTEIGRRFRVSWVAANCIETMFVGAVQSYQVAQQGPASFLTMQLEDDLGMLGRIALPTVTAQGAGETAGRRINRVLDAAQFDGDRNVGVGGVTVVAYEGGTNAAGYLQDVAKSEAGIFAAAADGTLTFLARERRRTLKVGVTDRTSRESGTVAAALSMPFTGSSDTIVTRVTVSAESPLDDVTVESIEGKARYGLRDRTESTLADTQDDVGDLANWLLVGRDRPDLSHREAVFLLESKSEALQQTLASVDVGDTVEVEWLPPGSDDPVTRLAQVERVRWQARPSRTRLSWTLSDLDGRMVGEVGSAIFGLVDSAIVGW